STLFDILVICYLFLFFFSSRRRHTRSLRDWSSDVCSSDLEHIKIHFSDLELSCHRGITKQKAALSCPDDPSFGITQPCKGPTKRSEERRVGKECRSRWWPED